MAKAKQAAKAVPGGKYPRTRSVTLPTLRLVEETAVFVTVTAPMAVSQVAQRPDKDGKVKEPATVMPVTNMDTGEVTQIIVGAALKGILTETYPKNGYVGLSFEITKHGKAAGKRYNTYSVFEIEA